MPNCQDCRFWLTENIAGRYPGYGQELRDFGRCQRIIDDYGVVKGDEAALVMGGDYADTPGGLLTTANFGCVLWEPDHAD